LRNEGGPSPRPQPADASASDDAPSLKSDDSSSNLAGVGPQATSAAAPQATVAGAAPTSAAHPAPVADQIASQIAAKAASGAASTRFDISLEPEGLGKVNVSVQINAAGQVTAAMTFDNPHAAAEARSGAGALQHALEQAGFNVAQGGLSFDVGGQNSGFARQDARPQTTSNAFNTPTETPVDVPSALSARYRASGAASGVDITI
jgi:flagellar hook-length control protein FliK